MTTKTYQLPKYEAMPLQRILPYGENMPPLTVTEEGEFGEGKFNREFSFILPGVVNAWGRSISEGNDLDRFSVMLQFNEPLMKPSRSMLVGKDAYRHYGFNSMRSVDVSELYLFTIRQLINPRVYRPYRSGPDQKNLFVFNQTNPGSEQIIANPLSALIKKRKGMTPSEVFWFSTEFIPTDQDTMLWVNKAYMAYPGEDGFRLNRWSCQFAIPPESTEDLPFEYLPYTIKKGSRKSELPTKEELQLVLLYLEKRNAMVEPLPGSYESGNK